uniref:Uncharacterized protein n=1 Tax=Cacopsylla melanoneura TaxID=428564 RepID=A0A8D8ZEL6_9HEMI
MLCLMIILYLGRYLYVKYYECLLQGRTYLKCEYLYIIISHVYSIRFPRDTLWMFVQYLLTHPENVLVLYNTLCVRVYINMYIIISIIHKYIVQDLSTVSTPYLHNVSFHF